MERLTGVLAEVTSPAQPAVFRQVRIRFRCPRCADAAVGCAQNFVHCISFVTQLQTVRLRAVQAGAAVAWGRVALADLPATNSEAEALVGGGSAEEAGLLSGCPLGQPLLALPASEKLMARWNLPVFAKVVARRQACAVAAADGQRARCGAWALWTRCSPHLLLLCVRGRPTTRCRRRCLIGWRVARRGWQQGRRNCLSLCCRYVPRLRPCPHRP